jgi:hypothetical protein
VSAAKRAAVAGPSIFGRMETVRLALRGAAREKADNEAGAKAVLAIDGAAIEHAAEEAAAVVAPISIAPSHPQNRCRRLLRK